MAEETIPCVVRVNRIMWRDETGLHVLRKGQKADVPKAYYDSHTADFEALDEETAAAYARIQEQEQVLDPTGGAIPGVASTQLKRQKSGAQTRKAHRR